MPLIVYSPHTFLHNETEHATLTKDLAFPVHNKYSYPLSFFSLCLRDLQVLLGHLDFQEESSV